jgi:predicted CXXCH cytochrome family protein
LSEPDVSAIDAGPDGGEETGTTNRRGRGVFAAVLVLLLLLCAITTITQSYLSRGDDEVVRGVLRNLECLQCHTELIPDFSRTAVHQPFMLERCTTCHTPHGEIRTETVLKGLEMAWNRVRTLVEWLPLKLVLDVFDTPDGRAPGEVDPDRVVSETTTEIKDAESELVMPANELCWMCHGNMGPLRAEPYTHAPFMNGYCVDCHDPHASDFAGMLTQDVRDLCVTCHKVGPEMARDQVHPSFAARVCLDCHNPHASSYRGILVDSQRSLCFTCHPSVARLSRMGVQHQPFLYDNCTGCHEPHGSNYLPLLIKNQPALCYDCHGEIKNDFLKVSHHPVGTISLNCSSCHDPHATNYVGLLYSEGNDICYDCHSVPIQASYDLSAHRSTPCWRCHTPHGSDWGPLLKGPQPEVCFPCHAKVDFDDITGGNDRNKHPVRPVFYDVNAKSALSCTSSCHNPHGSQFYFMLRHYQFPFDGNCLICHGVVPGEIVGVDF